MSEWMKEWINEWINDIKRDFVIGLGVDIVDGLGLLFFWFDGKVVGNIFILFFFGCWNVLCIFENFGKFLVF